MKIIDIVKKLYPFNYSVAGEGNDKSIKVFKKYLNFKIHKFKTKKKINGWIIPNSIKVLVGEIFFKDKKILDTKNSPFHSIEQSTSFRGYVKGNDLLKRLSFSKVCPQGIPYHWTGLYRPSQKTWGFSVKKSFLRKIKKNNSYYINLKVKKTNHNMNVLDFELKGKTKNTIILNAHNCHRFQANDDISGCAVGIKLIKHLKTLKKLNYTYRLIIAPELFGPMFWLRKFEKQKKNFVGAILLKSIGNKNKIKFQNSFKKQTNLDKSFEYILNEMLKKYTKGDFRSIYGNDETVFEAPGYSIPSISLTRFPFKEYHTDQDKPEKLSEKSLKQTFNIVLKTIEVLEKNFTLSCNHKGLLCLSNKKYDLYKDAYSPGIVNKAYTDQKRRWNLLMNCLPMEAEKGSSILELSIKYKLDFFELYEYLVLWKNKKLIKFNNLNI